MKFKLEYIMEVDDSELLELVNEFREDSESSPASTLDEQTK